MRDRHPFTWAVTAPLGWGLGLFAAGCCPTVAGPTSPAASYSMTLTPGEVRFFDAETPPSTTSVCPVTIAASGRQRRYTAPATSSAVRTVPAGACYANEDSRVSLLGKKRKASVSTTPALTAFTRIPRGPSS